MKHENKVVVITGGSRGIGKELCREFTTEGANVIFSYLRQEEQAKQLVQEIKEKGGKIESFQVDVSDYDKVRDMFQIIEKKYGKIDVLVNNAGMTSDALLFDMEIEQWKRVIDVNLNGAFYCIKEALPLLMESTSGCIVNMSSVMGSYGWPGLSNYAASKAGLDSLTRTLATELGRFDIRVNSVCPGLLETDMSLNARSRVGERVKKLTPLRKFGNTKDITKSVSFLASNDASYVTGELFMIRGGLGVGYPVS